MKIDECAKTYVGVLKAYSPHYIKQKQKFFLYYLINSVIRIFCTLTLLVFPRGSAKRMS